MTTSIRYPGISVELIGHDGNAFSVLGAVRGALRANGCDAGEIEAFSSDATSGDYNHLLSTVMRWVDVR